MAERSPHAPVALLSDSPLRDASRDYFGFAVYAEAIASLIDNELTDTPLTIALSAPWGGGKTSVARMVRRRLAERTASRGHDRPVVACWFDAWMHTDAEHLGAALASAVARTVDEARPRWRRLLSPLPAALVVAIPQLNDAVQGLIGEKPEERAGQLFGAVLLLFVVARSIFRVADDA